MARQLPREARPSGRLPIVYLHYLFHFWPLVQTLGCGPTVGSPWSSSTPPSLGRSRVAPPIPSHLLLLEYQFRAIWLISCIV